MKETEWTFKIPDFVKQEIKKGNMELKIRYFMKDGEVAKEIAVNDYISEYCYYWSNAYTADSFDKWYTYIVEEIDLRRKGKQK